MPTADRAVPICNSQTLARIRKTFRTVRSRDDWRQAAFFVARGLLPSGSFRLEYSARIFRRALASKSTADHSSRAMASAVELTFAPASYATVPGRQADLRSATPAKMPPSQRPTGLPIRRGRQGERRGRGVHDSLARRGRTSTTMAGTANRSARHSSGSSVSRRASHSSFTARLPNWISRGMAHQSRRIDPHPQRRSSVTEITRKVKRHVRLTMPFSINGCSTVVSSRLSQDSGWSRQR